MICFGLYAQKTEYFMKYTYIMLLKWIIITEYNEVIWQLLVGKCGHFFKSVFLFGPSKDLVKEYDLPLYQLELNGRQDNLWAF